MCNYESILWRKVCAFSEKYITTKDNKQVLDLSKETPVKIQHVKKKKKKSVCFSEMNSFKESELHRNNRILVFSAQLEYQKRCRK